MFDWVVNALLHFIYLISSTNHIGSLTFKDNFFDSPPNFSFPFSKRSNLSKRIYFWKLINIKVD